MTQLSIEDAVKLGLEHHRAGRFVEAERLYRQVLEVEPNQPDALHLMGALALGAGRAELAVELISRAVALRPGVAEFYWNLGRALVGCGRFDDAANSYRQAVSLRSESADIWNDLGNALQLGGKWEESVKPYERALELNPDSPDAWNNLGSARTELGQFEEALKNFEKALALRPEYPEAHSNVGNALQQMNRVEESIAAYERSLSQRPGYARAYNNMGRALRTLDRRDEAMAAVRKATELDPTSADAMNSLGTMLLDECRLDESIACYRRAIELQSDFAEAHFDLGRVLLLKGDFAAGWPEYESRWGMKDVRKTYPSLKHPLWDGSDVPDKTILLHAEQGYGDTIQFVRYTTMVRARCAKVIVAVPPVLGKLMSTCEGVDQVVVEDERVPKFDLRCPLLSLPRVFGTTLQTIPRSVPYLKVEEGKVDQWARRIGDSAGRLRVGLVWSGRPTFRDDLWRSIRFEMLAPILDVPDVEFHSLQLGEAAKQVDRARVRDWSSELHDFTDTASLLMNLDLLITTDTAAAHLAGALGRKVWVLIPFSPDWRWLMDREDNPWYPTMRLFRQDKVGDWETPIHRIKQAMGEL